MVSINEITIQHYKSDLFDQVVNMIYNQYGGEREYWSLRFHDFYEHPYQVNRCIRLVALDGEKVVGFQSIFYWPYLLNTQCLISYQSGNSLIHPDYRGHGIFGMLLHELETEAHINEADFIMGFPVKASYNSFIRANWRNILNLKWYVRIISPIPFFRKINFDNITFDRKAEVIPDAILSQGFTLSRDHDFQNWRDQYTIQHRYYYYHYNKGSQRLRFDLKIRLHGKITEMVIGKITTNSFDEDFLKKAFRSLIKMVYQQKSIMILSIALNDEYYESNILRALKNTLFFNLKNRLIYFIVKDYSGRSLVHDSKLWELYLSDIDTW